MIRSFLIDIMANWAPVKIIAVFVDDELKLEFSWRSSKSLQI